MKRIATLSLGLITCAWLSASPALAVPPTPNDSTGNAMGLLPGPFPLTVTGANIKVEQSTPAEMGGGGSDNLRVSFPASGPLKWTESRHNEGDISPLISPGEPNNPDSYPPNAFVDGYKPLDGQPFQKSTIAWRLNLQAGAALATVRHNGVNYGPNYTLGGSPVGTIHGIAYFNGSGSGWGYRMSDGEFSNGGAGSADLQMGIAGEDAGLGESSSSVAAAFFPYEQGWTGAWVDGTSFGEPTFGGSSPGLATSTVNFDNDIATVTLPGVNSATDGMLFVAPSHDGNSTNIAAALPTGGGWKVVSREDEDPDTTGQSLVFGPDNDFQFLYVPYTAGGLIGGHINGSNGSKIKSAGNFNLVRNSAGEYALSVFKADGVTKRTENDGMLILSVADSLPNDSTLPDRTFLSYQYDSGSGNFVIQSRELSATTGGTENQFGNVLSLRDTDFYVAWVDFTSPLTPTAAGDFNKDGKVNADDLAVWKGSFGKDNGADADGDGDSDGADFLVWQRNLGAGVASAAATTGIPEPSGVVLLTAAGALAMLRKRFG